MFGDHSTHGWIRRKGPLRTPPHRPPEGTQGLSVPPPHPQLPVLWVGHSQCSLDMATAQVPSRPPFLPPPNHCTQAI